MNAYILRAVAISALLLFQAGASETIQVDVRSILNGRSVTTLTDGKLVPWTQGIDGGGLADGYMTLEASLFNGDKAPKALPGDGVFKATAAHPEVRLNYGNEDGKGAQTRSVKGEGELAFPVPSKRYARMLLFMSSAEGPSHLSVTLAYADGSREQREIVLPDYYFDAPAGDPSVFSLASDLAKWNRSGHMAEANHHYIHGVELHPDAKKELIRVQVGKTAPAYLVFWGATGVTAD
jgi:hypothetical protein